MKTHSLHCINSISLGIRRSTQSNTVNKNTFHLFLNPSVSSLTQIASLLGVGLLTASLFTSSHSASAATGTWVGTNSGSWSDNANWVSNVVPAPADKIVIDMPSSSLDSFPLIGSGEIIQTDDISIGKSGYGSLHITDGGVMNSNNTNIGDEAGSTGLVEVSGSGSEWNMERLIYVGKGGDGSLYITDGGLVTSNGTYIGNGAGSTGLIEVSGNDSQLVMVNAFTVGNSGDGILRITDGGFARSANIHMGYSFGATGVVEVSGSGSQLNTNYDTTVGRQGDGIFRITNGGVATTLTSGRHGYIGREAGATGLVEVSDSGSQWNTSNTLEVGVAGDGIMLITNGGEVTSRESMIGSGSGSTGLVEVLGNGSQWRNGSSSLYIGYHGDGVLTIADGGDVRSQKIDIGYGTNAVGVLNIGNGNLAGTLNSMTSTTSITGGDGSATINFNYIDNMDFSPLMTGSLVVNHLNRGVTTLMAANDYSGATTVSAGTLQAGTVGAFSALSDHIVGTAGLLDMAGYDQTLASLSNAGTLLFNGTAGNAGTELTVAGDYHGNGGLLVMNTQLGGDNSLTDHLTVQGDADGQTYVKVNNAGGSGARTLNGIELIAVNGDADNADFISAGRIVAGAYDYSLGRGEGANINKWYLESYRPNVIVIDPVDPVDPTDPSPEEVTERVERPEAGSYTANLAAANNMFVTRLHDRLGETQYIDALTGEHKVTSMWLRNEGGHRRSRDESGQIKTQSNRYVLQLGGDIAQWHHNDLDRFHLGVMAGYGNSKSTSSSSISGYSSKGSVAGYSAGLYGTWYANDIDKSGLYVDSWMQYSWFNNTVNGQDLATEEYKSKGVTASVESGYTFKIGENAAEKARYFIQPKAQITWMGVKADDHKEANGTRVSGEGDGNIQTRLGVRAFMNGYSEIDKGKDREFQPFMEANWIHNTNDFGTTMNGVTMNQDGAQNIAEVKVGVEGKLNNRVNLWGNVAQQVGNAGYSDTAAMLGVKVNF